MHEDATVLERWGGQNVGLRGGTVTSSMYPSRRHPRDNLEISHNSKLVRILLYIAAPSIDDWHAELMRPLPLKKLTYTIHDNVKGQDMASVINAWDTLDWTSSHLHDGLRGEFNERHSWFISPNGSVELLYALFLFLCFCFDLSLLCKCGYCCDVLVFKFVKTKCGSLYWNTTWSCGLNLNKMILKKIYTIIQL